MKKILFLLITVLIISCQTTTKTSSAVFSLTGETHGLEDGTKILLHNLLADKIIDSVLVQNNIFKFSTTLPSSPFQVVVHTEDFSEYRFLWLENNPMTLDAKESSFQMAPSTGSATDKLAHDFFTKRDKLPREEQGNAEIEFVRTHPNSIISVSMLSGYSTTWGKSLTTELFKNLSAANKASSYGKNIEKFIGLDNTPIIGEKFVDFEMKNQDRVVERLSDFKGKTVLLEFWSSSCGPCRKENPNLVNTYSRFHSKGFEIFAVSQDTNKDKWLKAIKDDKLPWHQVSGLDRHRDTASLIYGVNSIPSNFLINTDGIIIAQNLRGDALNEKLLEILVDK